MCILALFALNFIHITQIFLRFASKKSLSLSGKTQYQALFNPRSYERHNSSSVFGSDCKSRFLLRKR